MRKRCFSILPMLLTMAAILALVLWAGADFVGPGP